MQQDPVADSVGKGPRGEVAHRCRGVLSKVVDNAGRTVTSKVMAIFAAFEDAPASMSLSQIAEAAEIPLPTAHRLVGELVQWGALEKESTGRYTIGMRLWEVAQLAGRQLRETARPFLQDLFSLTQETAHLAVREGREALYVDRVYSSKRVPRASRVGGRLPLHATAVGKVLMRDCASTVKKVRFFALE